MSSSITISTEEYDQLVKDSEFCWALKAAGVDNWQGYDDAMAILREDEDA